MRRQRSRAASLGVGLVVTPIFLLMPPVFLAFFILDLAETLVDRLHRLVIWLDDLSTDFFEWWAESIAIFAPTQEEVDRATVRGIARDLKEINNRMKPKGPHGW